MTCTLALILTRRARGRSVCFSPSTAPEPQRSRDKPIHRMDPRVVTVPLAPQLHWAPTLRESASLRGSVTERLCQGLEGCTQKRGHGMFDPQHAEAVQREQEDGGAATLERGHGMLDPRHSEAVHQGCVDGGKRGGRLRLPSPRVGPRVGQQARASRSQGGQRLRRRSCPMAFAVGAVGTMA